MTIGEEIAQAIGPRGGNLERPKSHPEFRRARHNAPVLANGEIGLHRFEDTATQGRKNELPWHAMAAALIVEGKSNKYIAELAGVSEVTISQLKATAWFQEKIALLTSQATGGAMARLSAELDKSIDVLVSLRDLSENEKVVADVCKFLVNHGAGMPIQKVVSLSATTSFSSEQEEMADIQQQLAALRRQKETLMPETATGEKTETKTTDQA